jgi:GTP-binding protein HflX
MKSDEREKAIIAGFRPGGVEPGDTDDPYIELARLAETSGARVLTTITQKETRPTAQFHIGLGKVEEIAEAVTESGAGLVIFNNELSPLQFRNLEKELGVKVIDRTQLILDIFAMRAQSSEGKIQVELAQLEYLLPRIAGRGIELSRLGGGIGTRGPGETKLESDRRRIRARITTLKKKLDKVEKNRLIQKQRREKARIPVVSLVGYTNAGKTTLFNALSNEKAFVEDKLFATLDPLTRRIYIPDVGNALLVDTVGFIKHLPVHLVESFKSTLEGVRDASALLHVVDVSNPQFQEQMDEVGRIIVELGATEVPLLIVFNKIDLLEKPERLQHLLRLHPDAVAVSAKCEKDFASLKSAIKQNISSGASKEPARPPPDFDADCDGAGL